MGGDFLVSELGHHVLLVEPIRSRRGCRPFFRFDVCCLVM
jgi:hypothetical protein